MPGIRIPPMNPPLNVKSLILRVVVAVNSWSHRKYQGALAGIGVTEGFAGPSKGARENSASTKVTTVVATNINVIRLVKLGDVLTEFSLSSTSVEVT